MVENGAGRAVPAFVEVVRGLWFPILASQVVLWALTLPGLPAEQISESLVGLASDVTSPWLGFNWLTAAATLMAFGLLSVSLRLALFQLSAGLKFGLGVRAFYLALIWYPLWIALAANLLRANGALAAASGQWATPLLVMAIIALAAPVGVQLAVRRRPLSTAIVWLRGGPLVRRWRPFLLPLAFAVAVIAIAVPPLGLPVDAVALSEALGPIAIVALAAACWIALASSLTLFGRRRGWPISPVLLLIAASLVFGWFDLNDNHPIRGSDGATHRMPSFSLVVVEWTKAHPSRAGHHDPIVVVSAEGGGIRAAYATALALARIGDRCPLLARRIFAISSVSGGSIGAAVYAAAVHDHPPATSELCDFAAPAGQLEKGVNQMFGHDLLSPMLARTLFPDALQRFLPFPIDAFDRQLGLEFALTEAFREAFGSDALGRSVYDIVPDAHHPATPNLFINTTSVERGDRVVATGSQLLDEDFARTRSFWDVNFTRDFPLVSMAATSARFPYLSPSGYVANGGSKERFVDGGYADNSGATTAMELFYALLLSRTAYSPPLFPADTPVVLLHIGNQQVCNGGTSNQSPVCVDSPDADQYLDELFSPLRAVLNARSAAVDYTLRQLERTITRGQDGVTNIDAFDDLVRLQLTDEGIAAPLGWLLSKRAMTEISRQLDPRTTHDCSETRGYDNPCAFARLAAMLKAIAE